MALVGETEAHRLHFNNHTKKQKSEESEDEVSDEEPKSRKSGKNPKRKLSVGDRSDEESSRRRKRSRHEGEESDEAAPPSKKNSSAKSRRTSNLGENGLNGSPGVSAEVKIEEGQSATPRALTRANSGPSFIYSAFDERMLSFSSCTVTLVVSKLTYNVDAVLRKSPVCDPHLSPHFPNAWICRHF